jgi:hypothetical protein
MNLRLISEFLGVIVILSGITIWYHETDQDGLEEMISEMSLTTLKPALAGYYKTKCQKEAAGQELPDFIWEQIESGQDRHIRLAGREYHPRPCR